MPKMLLQCEGPLHVPLSNVVVVLEALEVHPTLVHTRFVNEYPLNGLKPEMISDPGNWAV